MFFRLLPWEYAIRNLFRRPLRTGLTLVGLTTVVVMVLVVVGFIRGLETSLAVSGDASTAIVFEFALPLALVSRLSMKQATVPHTNEQIPKNPEKKTPPAFGRRSDACDTTGLLFSRALVYVPRSRLYTATFSVYSAVDT